MSSLPAISPRGRQESPRVNTPRKELVTEYTIKRRANEERLANDRQAFLDEAAARAESQRQRKLEFKKDIEAQIESQRRAKEAMRQDELSPTRGSIMQTVTDDASNKQLARQKARDALLQSEMALQERQKHKSTERERDQNEEAATHKKLQDERVTEMDADYLRRKALADSMAKDRKIAEKQRRERSLEREAKLKEERAIADEIALIAERQRYEDEQRARAEKKLIADVNAEVARNSGRLTGAEKAAERDMRREYEEAEKIRQRKELEDKAAARQRLHADIEADAQKRQEFSRTRSSDRSLNSTLGSRSGDRAAAEVNAVKQEQARRQKEYRAALEQQIQEHSRRRFEQLQS
ncbi:Hypothetical protein, putative [Bodo saltans]|uniref:Trichohyalin-plectin-homology domain-containing protein n=1 Tax=Bodo saltans TaxID=75058 RepID=A0A0S4JGY2_BODSA|nr:Hypothetical protein, putative [Bodo saltans]|eukprot:CUG89404.1 Hypothetical protein, putative [Bodo saltans]